MGGGGRVGETWKMRCDGRHKVLSVPQLGCGVNGGRIFAFPTG